MLSHSSCVQLFVTLRTVALQAPLSMGVLQARILEWVAMTSSRGSSQPRDCKHVSYISCIGRRILSPLVPPGKPQFVVQFSSVTQSCLILCNPLDWTTPGFPIHHRPPELAQTHVHLVSKPIQPFHPIIPFYSCLQSFPASGSFPMSELFASGGQSIGASASVLPMNIQD